jgi:transcription initiation factor TFIIIB Brf1 subunit/transcription initiation factor TFIIB
MVCRQCGLVLANAYDGMMDERSYQYAAQSEDYPLSGPNPVHRISIGKSSSSSTAVSQIVARSIRHDEMREEGNRSTHEGFKLLKAFCAGMSLKTPIIQWANEIFRDATDAKARTGGFRGKKLELAVAACVIAACRVAKFPRSETEVCDSCGIKDVPGVVKMYGNIVDLVIDKWYSSTLQDVVRPRAYINRFIRNVHGIDDGTVRTVRKRVDDIADIVENKCALENKGADIVCSAMIVQAMQECQATFDTNEFALRCRIPARSIELVVEQLQKTLK